jgi:isopenicillin N synthase-like dioxygenase
VAHSRVPLFREAGEGRGEGTKSRRDTAGRDAAIPVIDIAPLRDAAANPATRAAIDHAIGEACRHIGFFTITGYTENLAGMAALRAAMRRFFDLSAAEKRKVARRKYAPENKNIYRGYFHPLNGMPSYKEGIDLGLEPSGPSAPAATPDPLREANVWPDEAALPGWRAAMGDYAEAMVQVGHLLLHSFARHLGLSETWFDAFFADSASTLRLLRYPPRPPESVQGIESETFLLDKGVSRPSLTGEHTDSGCVTLLWQDAVGGLQARGAAGDWIDVPSVPDSLVVNLGDLMQFWTGGAFRATPHRVLGGAIGQGDDRYSIPFFFEPSLDARIAPVPTAAAPVKDAAPIRYGDHLLRKTLRYTEFRDFLKV